MLSEREYLRAMAIRIRAVAYNCLDLNAVERLRPIAEEIEERAGTMPDGRANLRGQISPGGSNHWRRFLQVR
jgi:hypothetical protein